MPNEEIKSKIERAIEALKAEQPPLDFSDVHERSIAHRLAVHLEPHFPEWNVDCEYDRDGQLKKALENIKQCSAKKKTDDILPDIIVHHRRGGGRDNNLLVIEMKKNKIEDPCDTQKLRLLTDPSGHYRYQLGLYIDVDGGRFALTWYRDGAVFIFR